MTLTLIIATVLIVALLSTLGVAPNVRDASLVVTRALPNGAATVTSTSIDTGKGPKGDQAINIDWELAAPVLNSTRLPDTQTVTYNIITSANADLSSPTTLYPSVVVQTGASSAGAAAATFRFKLPSSAGRYVGFTAVKTGAADASGASATLQPVV